MEIQNDNSKYMKFYVRNSDKFELIYAIDIKNITSKLVEKNIILSYKHDLSDEKEIEI
jgi:hypothetical protein